MLIIFIINFKRSNSSFLFLLEILFYKRHQRKLSQGCLGIKERISKATSQPQAIGNPSWQCTSLHPVIYACLQSLPHCSQTPLFWKSYLIMYLSCIKRLNSPHQSQNKDQNAYYSPPKPAHAQNMSLASSCYQPQLSMHILSSSNSSCSRRCRFLWQVCFHHMQHSLLGLYIIISLG